MMVSRLSCLGVLAPALMIAMLLSPSLTVGVHGVQRHNLSVGDVYVLMARGLAFTRVGNQTVRVRVAMVVAFNVTDISGNRAKLSVVKGFVKLNSTTYAVDGGNGVVTVKKGRLYLGFKGYASSDEGKLAFAFVGRVLRKNGRTGVVMVGRIRTDGLTYRAFIRGFVKKLHTEANPESQSPSTPLSPKRPREPRRISV